MDIDPNNLTPEQQKEVDTAFQNSAKLSVELSEILQKHPIIEQVGSVIMILGAIVLSDLESGRFDTADAAAAHYIEGALAVVADMQQRGVKA